MKIDQTKFTKHSPMIKYYPKIQQLHIWLNPMV